MKRFDTFLIVIGSLNPPEDGRFPIVSCLIN